MRRGNPRPHLLRSARWTLPGRAALPANVAGSLPAGGGGLRRTIAWSGSSCPRRARQRTLPAPFCAGSLRTAPATVRRAAKSALPASALRHRKGWCGAGWCIRWQCPARSPARAAPAQTAGNRALMRAGWRCITRRWRGNAAPAAQ